jgi:flagellar biosynthesis/type III secretory pathway protein FliH
MLELPRELEKEVSLELAEFERERKMPYVTSIERIAREEGMAQGKAEGKMEGMAAAKIDALLRILTKKIPGAVPADLQASIRATHNLARLDSWIDTAFEASDLEDFRRSCGI